MWVCPPTLAMVGAAVSGSLVATLPESSRVPSAEKTKTVLFAATMTSCRPLLSMSAMVGDELMDPVLPHPAMQRFHSSRPERS